MCILKFSKEKPHTLFNIYAYIYLILLHVTLFFYHKNAYKNQALYATSLCSMAWWKYITFIIINTIIITVQRSQEFAGHKWLQVCLNTRKIGCWHSTAWRLLCISSNLTNFASFANSNRLKPVLWIRVQVQRESVFSNFVNPDPNYEYGSGPK